MVDDAFIRFAVTKGGSISKSFKNERNNGLSLPRYTSFLFPKFTYSHKYGHVVVARIHVRADATDPSAVHPNSHISSFSFCRGCHAC